MMSHDIEGDNRWTYEVSDKTFNESQKKKILKNKKKDFEMAVRQIFVDL